MSKPIPEGFHTITPIFVFKDSRKAIEFYSKAFGAVDRGVMPSPDGKSVMHAEMKIGDSIVMMSDEHPQQPCKSAQTLGTSPVTFYVYVQDADAAFARAVSAGCTVQMPVSDMFWGDRMGSVKDPFGHSWMIGTRVRDLTPEQMAKGAQEAFAKMGKK